VQIFSSLKRLLFPVSVLIAASCAPPAGESSATTFAYDIPSYPSTAVCPAPRKPGGPRCLAHVRTDTQGKPAVSAAPTAGYGPKQIQSAYNLPATGGAGQTVALIDAYDDPNAESDLAAYRAQFGLPPCTTANGCFRKVNQDGQQGNYPGQDPQGEWPGETSLDLDAVSAACPGCNILLVEANDDDISDLGTANNTAASLGATAISNSWGGAEDTSDPDVQAQYFNHPGILITASSGDDGYGTIFPASSPFVLGVGGTSLVLAAGTARGWAETAWSNGGSGCSAIMPKPSWQTDTGCGLKTVADVSADADPNTGLAVYQSGWEVIGGTSEASPLIAAIFALTGKASAGPSFPYSNVALFNDVTTGSNGNCGGSYLCTAGVGYDGPTGVGTPNGALWSSASGDGGTTQGSDAGTADSGGSVLADAGGGGGSTDSGATVEDASGPDGDAGPPVSGPLQVTLVSPADGATLPANSQVQLVAQVDSSVGLAQVVLDWQMPTGTVQVNCATPPANTTCTISGDTYTWSFLGTTGSRTWSVTAKDTAGNSVQSAQRSVSFVNEGQPQVTILAPAAGTAYAPGDVVQVIASATGPQGVSQVWLTWTPPSASPTQYELSYLGGNEWYVNLPPIQSAAVSGSRLLTVTAYDPSNVTGSAEVTVQVQ